MFRVGSSISLAAVLALSGAAATATEPLVAEPRMVGDADAGKLYIHDATAVGEDLAFLGARGREQLSLRWFDAQRERERKLQTVPSGEMPRVLAPARGGIIFTGYREREGTEPWRSDGTRTRTKLIREVHAGRQLAKCVPAIPCPTYPAGSDPQSFVTVGRTTYFPANHPRYGMELWRTDGTRAGTKLIRDVQPGAGSGLELTERSLVAHLGRVFFTADDGRHGRELWSTKGTRESTRMIKDIGPRDSVPWWGSEPVAAGEFLYFTAERPDEGLELWRTDGTRARTQLVLDIWPGPKGSQPEDLTAVGDTLYFTAQGREHGRELWRTDGSRRGTALVADLSPGPTPSVLGDLIGLGDTLYFTSWDLSDELTRPGALWRTDGTGEGTEHVELGTLGSIAAADSDGLRRNWSEFPTIATHSDRLYLTYDDGLHGNEPWVIDGETGEAALLADIRPGPRGSKPEWLTVADGALYLTAADGEHGRQLWSLPLAAPTEEPAGS